MKILQLTQPKKYLPVKFSYLPDSKNSNVNERKREQREGKYLGGQIWQTKDANPWKPSQEAAMIKPLPRKPIQNGRNRDYKQNNILLIEG